MTIEAPQTVKCIALNRSGVRILACASVVLWLALVAWVMLTSHPPGFQWLVALANRFASPKTAMKILQALLHLVLFGIGALAGAWALASVRPTVSRVSLFVVVLVCVLVVGGVLEWLQEVLRVPGRHADLRDFAGDFAGAVLFLGILWAAGAGPFGRRPGSPTADS